MATYAPIKLPSDDIQQLDELVSDGRYPNRTAAVRAALRLFFKEEFDRRLAASVRAAYEKEPPTEEELELARAGTRSLAAHLKWLEQQQ